MSNKCFNCGYLQKLNDKYYCVDRDCFVDPLEPECIDECI